MCCIGRDEVFDSNTKRPLINQGASIVHLAMIQPDSYTLLYWLTKLFYKSHMAKSGNRTHRRLDRDITLVHRFYYGHTDLISNIKYRKHTVI